MSGYHGRPFSIPSPGPRGPGTLAGVSLLADLRIAARTLLRSPARLLLPASVLGLALASAVVMWGVFRCAVLESPPIARADRVFTLALGPSDELENVVVALPDLQRWWWAQTTFEGLAGFRSLHVAVADAGPPDRLPVGLVTGPFFQLLRQEPLLGRVLGAEDTRAEAPAVAVLSERLWRARLGGRPDVLGRTIRVDGLPCTVVGIVPAAFDLPVGAALWTAFRSPARGAPERFEWFTPIGRLRDGVAPEEARAELAALTRPRSAPGGLDRVAPLGALEPELRPLSLAWLGPRYARILRALLTSVTLVLLLAAANVAGLLLIRAAGRAHEAAIRRALGASRARVTVELLAEPALIGAAAALLGLTLAAGAMEVLRGTVARALAAPAWLDLRIDGALLLVLVAAALAAALAAGLYPAIRASGLALDPLLREGTRHTGLRAGRLVRGLVVVELALAAAVLSSAGVVVRAAARLAHGDVGVPTGGLLVGRLVLPSARYDWLQAGELFWKVDRALPGLPGAAAAALTVSAPGVWGDWRNGFEADTGETGAVDVVPVGPRFFETLRVPILAGRAIGADDRGAASERVVVVSDALARLAWPNQSPLGRRIVLAPGTPDARPFTVVGVAKSVRHDQRVQSLDSSFPTVYPALLQWHGWSAQVVLRAAEGLEPRALAPALQRAVAAIAPDVALATVRTLDEERSSAAAGFGLIGWMFAAFGAVAVTLAATGIYGVLAAAVAQGARELALRRALGASDRALVGLILRRSVGQLGAGLALGGALAPLAARAVGGALEAQPHAAAVYSGVAIVLLAVVALAVAIPVRRGLRRDPGPELRGGAGGER